MYHIETQEDWICNNFSDNMRAKRRDGRRITGQIEDNFERVAIAKARSTTRQRGEQNIS